MSDFLWRHSLNFFSILSLIFTFSGSLPTGNPPFLPWAGTSTLAAAAPLSDEFLAKQSLALRPGFRDDIARLQDIPRYKINALVNLQTSTIYGVMWVSYTNKNDSPLPDLAFRLYPNANAIYGGGSLKVEWVKRDGKKLDFVLTEKDTALWVPLDPPLAPGEMGTVSISFTARIPTTASQGYLIFYQGKAVTSLAAWYPILTCYRRGWEVYPIPTVGDTILATTSFHELVLTAPPGYTVVSTGTTLDHYETDIGTVWHIVSGPSRSFTIIMGDRFLQEQVKVDDITINYYALNASHPNTTRQKAIAIAQDAFITYTKRFGQYPLAEFDLVETAVSIGGYEFAGMVALEHTTRVQSSLGQYRFMVAHEIAHQWWYNLVGSNQVLDPWLDESMSTYSIAIYLEEAVGPAAARGLLASFKQEYGQPTNKSAPIDSSTLDFHDWVSYRTPVYYHGALFLAALRQEMGNDTFFRLLQTYYQQYRYQIATTAGFLQLAETIAGRDLTPLYKQWFIRHEPWRAGGPKQD